jgi:chaperone modulatory protein CbpM
MRLAAVAALFAGLGEAELNHWIARGWIAPDIEDDGPSFHDIDLARIRLILDLRQQMRIEDETIPLILSLLDQIYELRGQLRSVIRAVEAQPDPVREAIRAVLR